MISVIIPTYNRSHLLPEILESYISQKYVDEILIVDDCSKDNTNLIVGDIIKNNNKCKINYFFNEKKMGAAACKIFGAEKAKNDLILFGEDDVLLSDDYCKVLYEKYNSIEKVGVLSGRIIYKKYLENNFQALNRVGDGLNNRSIFNKVRFSLNWAGKITGTQPILFTHALFLVNKNLFLENSSNRFKKGNQFREETAAQIEILLKGYKNYITAETTCFHLDRREIIKGGQKINRVSRYYWSVKNTNKFFLKYFLQLRPFTKVNYGNRVAIVLFALNELFVLFVKPLKKLIIR